MSWMTMSDFLRGFHYALCGVWRCIWEERNFRVHMVAVSCVLWLGRFYRFTCGEKAVLAVTCGLVLMGELVNSAVERAVDLCTGEFHPLAKAAKDMAAGAVLLSACTAVAVGALLFGRREGLEDCAVYFVEQPMRLVGAAGAVAAAVLFIFMPWRQRR